MAAAEKAESLARGPGLCVHRWELVPSERPFGDSLIEAIDAKSVMGSGPTKRISLFSRTQITECARINQTRTTESRVLHTQAVGVTVSTSHRTQGPGVNNDLLRE